MAGGDYYEVKLAYREAFGIKSLDWCNDFALNPDEVRACLMRALERGSPVTDEEITWLERDMRDDCFY